MWKFASVALYINAFFNNIVIFLWEITERGIIDLHMLTYFK